MGLNAVSSYFRPLDSLSDSISIGEMLSDEVSIRERFIRLRLVAQFTRLMTEACERQGITPWSAKELEFSIPDILDEAEEAVGIARSRLELEMMNRWQRYEAEYVSMLRKRHAYLTFLRLTSGVCDPKPPSRRQH